MNLAFLIPHYGLEIYEPLEIYCRTTSENLYRRGIDVTVYTTTDGRKEGEYILNGVLIKRFRPEKSKDFSSRLLKNLKENEKKYDAIVFFGTQSEITLKGVVELKGKKVLVPYLYNISSENLEVFSRVDGVVFVTEKEKIRIKLDNQKVEVIDFGIDLKEKVDPNDFKKRHFILSDYILCRGKDENLKEIFEKFWILKKNFPFLKLIITGEFSKCLPFNPEIKYMALREEKDRVACIKGSLFAFIPFVGDEPDFLFFETMSLGVPVVVDQRMETLLDYCLRSNGGLWYSGMEEFLEISSLLIEDKPLRSRLGREAKKYIKENHSPEKNFLKWKDFLSSFI